MNDFQLYVTSGFNHVSNLEALDHILFLIVLAIVFSFKQWEKALWLITFFTIGHTTTLALAAYKVVNINVNIIEFLIPVTIFITAVSNILTVKNSSTGKENVNLFFALFFGLIHGLGFSSSFKIMIGSQEDKLLPLLEFALGIELSQVLFLGAILMLGALMQNVFKVSKRDWILVASSIVIGFAIQMMMNRVFW